MIMIGNLRGATTRRQAVRTWEHEKGGGHTHTRREGGGAQAGRGRGGGGGGGYQSPLTRVLTKHIGFFTDEFICA